MKAGGMEVKLYALLTHWHILISYSSDAGHIYNTGKSQDKCQNSLLIEQHQHQNT